LDQLILIATGMRVCRTRGDTQTRGVADQTSNPVTRSNKSMSVYQAVVLGSGSCLVQSTENEKVCGAFSLHAGLREGQMESIRGDSHAAEKLN
jgi:hypothetical protein